MRAVIYIRVSTEEQAEEGYSLAAQERACRAYAEAQGWAVEGVYADEGLSGTLEPQARARLAAALAAIREKRAQVFLVHKLDRLARSIRIANELIEEFQKRGVSFIAVADRIDLSTPFGWAAFQMQNVWNELYIKNLKFETAKGHREKARAGYWVGPLPLGYQKDDAGRLVASPDAPVILLIFELYASGRYSYTDIADELNRRGHRALDWQTKQRNLFGRESVRTILRNRAYIGMVSAGGQEFPGKHEPLITMELWQAAERLRGERSREGRKVSVKGPKVGGLLTEVTYCAKCGDRMWFHHSGNEGSRGMYYVCGGRSRRTCDAKFCRGNLVEGQVLDCRAEHASAAGVAGCGAPARGAGPPASSRADDEPHGYRGEAPPAEASVPRGRP